MYLNLNKMHPFIFKQLQDNKKIKNKWNIII
jgi:hypothetical protein